MTTIITIAGKKNFTPELTIAREFLAVTYSVLKLKETFMSYKRKLHCKIFHLVISSKKW